MKTYHLLAVVIMTFAAVACSKDDEATSPENYLIFGDITRTVRAAGMDPVSCKEVTKDGKPWLEFVISWASSLQIALINEQEYVAIAIPSSRLDEETLKISHIDVLTWQIDLNARFDADAFERGEDYYMNIYHKGEIMDLKCHYLGKPEVVYLLPPNLRRPTF